ncbi:hypothetical protein JCM11641_004743 [Rhodosporidiobolus odoratus]
MSNKAVPAVYRSIISSTVSQIRPDFDALGVEEAVLQELVRLWELKLAQSRAADFTGDDRLEGVARGFLPRDPNEKREDAEPEKSTSSRKPKKEGSDGEDGEGDDEDAINSDLDDDDDLDEQDDAEGAEAGGDLVIALYEKVQRVKNKWKVTLKDGLVSVNGKEYLFAKCQGRTSLGRLSSRLLGPSPTHAPAEYGGMAQDEAEEGELPSLPPPPPRPSAAPPTLGNNSDLAGQSGIGVRGAAARATTAAAPATLNIYGTASGTAPSTSNAAANPRPAASTSSAISHGNKRNKLAFAFKKPQAGPPNAGATGSGAAGGKAHPSLLSKPIIVSPQAGKKALPSVGQRDTEATATGVSHHANADATTSSPSGAPLPTVPSPTNEAAVAALLSAETEVTVSRALSTKSFPSSSPAPRPSPRTNPLDLPPSPPKQNRHAPSYLPPHNSAVEPLPPSPPSSGFPLLSSASHADPLNPTAHILRLGFDNPPAPPAPPKTRQQPPPSYGGHAVSADPASYDGRSGGMYEAEEGEYMDDDFEQEKARSQGRGLDERNEDRRRDHGDNQRDWDDRRDSRYGHHHEETRRDDYERRSAGEYHRNRNAYGDRNGRDVDQGRGYHDHASHRSYPRYDDHHEHHRSHAYTRRRSHSRSRSRSPSRERDSHDRHRSHRHDDEHELQNARSSGPRGDRTVSRSPLSPDSATGSRDGRRNASRSRSPYPRNGGSVLDERQKKEVEYRMNRSTSGRGQNQPPPPIIHSLPARPPKSQPVGFQVAALPFAAAPHPDQLVDATPHPLTSASTASALPRRAPPPPPPLTASAVRQPSPPPPPAPVSLSLPPGAAAPMHAANPGSLPSEPTSSVQVLSRNPSARQSGSNSRPIDMEVDTPPVQPSPRTPAAPPALVEKEAENEDPPRVRTRRAQEEAWLKPPSEDEVIRFFASSPSAASLPPPPTKERKYIGTSPISSYTLQEKLGEGTFGVVWKGIRGAASKASRTGPGGGGVGGIQEEMERMEEEKLIKKGLRVRKGDVVALKEIIFHNKGDGLPITSVREIRILKMLDHPNVVPVVDIAYEAADPASFALGKTFMVFPYMDHDLAGLLENPKVTLEMEHIKQYSQQLLKGTEYLHQNNILHRDMKAANLLINNKGELMIADFGLARSVEKASANASYTSMVVTRWYRPPELLLGEKHYHAPIDMWGVGCVLAEMFHRSPIFPGDSDMNQAQRIFGLCGAPNDRTMPGWTELPGIEGFSKTHFADSGRSVKPEWERRANDPLFGDLMDQILVLDPKKRLTASEALDHEWFWSKPYPCHVSNMPQFSASHEMDRRKRIESQQPGFAAPTLPPPQPLPQAVQYFPAGGVPPPPPPPDGMGYPPAPMQMGQFNGPPAPNPYNAPPAQMGIGQMGGGMPMHHPHPLPMSMGYRGGGMPPQQHQSFAARGMGASLNRPGMGGGLGGGGMGGVQWSGDRGRPGGGGMGMGSQQQQGKKVNLLTTLGGAAGGAAGLPPKPPPTRR